MLGILSWPWSGLEEGAVLAFTFGRSWVLGKPQSSHCQPDLELTRLWPQAESRSLGPNTSLGPDLDAEASRTRF